MDRRYRGEGKRGRGRGRGGGANRDEDRDVRLSKSLSYTLRHGAAKMGLNMGSDGFVFVDELLTHVQFSSFSLEDVERVVATNIKQRFKLQNHPENGRLQIRANQGHTVQVEDLDLTPVVLDAPDCPREAVHGSYMKNWPSIRSQGLCRMKRAHIHLAPGLPGEGQVISGASHREIGLILDLPPNAVNRPRLVWCPSLRDVEMDRRYCGEGKRGRGRGGGANQDEDRDVRLSKSLSYTLRHGAAKMGLNMGSGMRQNCDLAVYINVPKALADGIEFYWSENKVLLTPGDSEGVLAPRYFSRAQRLKPSPCELDLE